MAPQTDVIPWDYFRRNLEWYQGEHVTLIGPTGSGKTTLALELLPLQPYVVVFGTKRRDETMDKLRGKGYITIHDGIIPDSDVARRIIVAPPLRKKSDIQGQRKAFEKSLDAMFRQGGWTLYLDECLYITDKPCQLKDDVELLWMQGRSLGVSVVAGTQRPYYVPLLAYDQATHLFLWRDNDKRNLDRFAEMNGSVDPEEIRHEVSTMPKHDVLYVNTRTGERVRTRVN